MELRADEPSPGACDGLLAAPDGEGTAPVPPVGPGRIVAHESWSLGPRPSRRSVVRPGARPAPGTHGRGTRSDRGRECGGAGAELRPPGSPGHPRKDHTVLQCLHVVLKEEWQHHRYAVRDLRCSRSGPDDRSASYRSRRAPRADNRAMPDLGRESGGSDLRRACARGGMHLIRAHHPGPADRSTTAHHCLPKPSGHDPPRLAH